MTKLYKKLATATATAAMLGQMVMPAFAATTTFEISGNGSRSENEIEYESKNETGVFQTNESNIVNNISVSSNTGDNDANDNTGGDVSTDTGNVNFEANIVNQAGFNHAEVEACDCETDTTVKVNGNGTRSENEVEVENRNESVVVQDNFTDIDNQVRFKANTGDNDANDNTGGEVKIETGNVGSSTKPVLVAIHNRAGVNTALIGGNGSGDSEVKLTIAGNGKKSENEIEIENDRETGIYQMNDTSILNDVYLEAMTGRNDANDNTGDSAYSDPSITTGNVDMALGLFNDAGFNAAEADCGCVLGVQGSIMDNGTESESEIEVEFDDELEVKQDNVDALMNTGDIKSDTGHNDADDNTGGEVNTSTGNTDTQVVASNTGGWNVFGTIDVEWPWEN